MPFYSFLYLQCHLLVLRGIRQERGNQSFSHILHIHKPQVVIYLHELAFNLASRLRTVCSDTAGIMCLCLWPRIRGIYSEGVALSVLAAGEVHVSLLLYSSRERENSLLKDESSPLGLKWKWCRTSRAVKPALTSASFCRERGWIGARFLLLFFFFFLPQEKKGHYMTCWCREQPGGTGEGEKEGRKEGRQERGRDGVHRGQRDGWLITQASNTASVDISSRQTSHLLSEDVPAPASPDYNEIFFERVGRRRPNVAFHVSLSFQKVNAVVGRWLILSWF